MQQQGMMEVPGLTSQARCCRAGKHDALMAGQAAVPEADSPSQVSGVSILLQHHSAAPIAHAPAGLPSTQLMLPAHTGG